MFARCSRCCLPSGRPCSTGSARESFIATRLGYNPRFFERLRAAGTITRQAEYELFRRLASAWPKGEEKPHALSVWEREHPDAKPHACQDGMIRRCLTCGDEFLSEGPHNRLCNRHRLLGSAEDSTLVIPAGGV